MKNAPACALGLLTCVALSGTVHAQTSVKTDGGVVSGGETVSDAPEWMAKLAIDPASPAAKKYAEQQKVRIAAEKQLRKIRVKHFGPVRNQQVRQEGIVKVREYTDPALYPMMLEVLGREGRDVRIALMDHFQDAASEEGDATLAWMGVFDGEAEMRAEATKRLKARIAKLGEVPRPVKLVVFQGLSSTSEPAIASSAMMANNLNILEAIPWLISGQLLGAPQQTGTGLNNASGNGALAWILVGQQVAFVSDLTPVVGPSAVAFDPQLSTVTEGVLLRVVDAVVVTYNLDVHNALTDMTSRAWGKPTDRLGWNVPAWRRWYRDEFLPHLAEKQVAQAKPEVK